MDDLFRHYRFVYFAVNTYDPVISPDALRMAENAYDELLSPFISAEMDVWAEYYRSGSHRPKRFKPVALQWQRVQAAFPLRALALGLRIEGNAHRLPDREIGGLGIHFSEDPTRASALEFGAVPDKLYGGPFIPPSIQSRVVDLAIGTFESVNGVTGYITHDYIGADSFGNDSPYEQWLGHTYRWSSLEFRARTRGYYWGNFLTQRHVDLLGGAKVLENAPVALVKRIRDGWYLQLTDDINHIDRVRLSALKEFLAPVLPQLPADWPREPESHRHRLYDFRL